MALVAQLAPSWMRSQFAHDHGGGGRVPALLAQRVREMVASGLARRKDGARNLYRRPDVERLVADPG